MFTFQNFYAKQLQIVHFLVFLRYAIKNVHFKEVLRSKRSTFNFFYVDLNFFMYITLYSWINEGEEATSPPHLIKISRT